MSNLQRRLQIAAILSLATILSSCSTFPTQELNKEANQSLRVIAVAPVGMPDKPMVTIVNAVGNSFGLIGAAVEATRASNASNEAVTEFANAGLTYKTRAPRAPYHAISTPCPFQVVNITLGTAPTLPNRPAPKETVRRRSGH